MMYGAVVNRRLRSAYFVIVNYGIKQRYVTLHIF